MTEQPDTAVDSGRDYAHVLAWFRETKGVGIAPTDIVLALRDLDAARAERDNWRKAAEGEAAWRRDWHRRAEAAEARIAAVEALADSFRCDPEHRRWKPSQIAAEIHRALTGGTE